ncbi:MAG: M28 family peptidase [Clostridia bacterium]|nr:M28 family peptidase [Clostridia bacterium]
MRYISEIIEKFPIRKKDEQKTAFLDYAVAEAEKMGYAVRMEAVKKNRNLIIGDPDTARVIYTAHYDTPARMFFPNFITPRNILIYILYNILIVSCVFAVAFLAGWLAKAVLHIESSMMLFWIGWAVYMAVLFLMLLGPANKHNANDNTSGVATLLSIMEKLPESARKHTAFIFFDNEEAGMKGSGKFASAHKQTAKTAFTVNFDCVGDGKDIFVIAKKAMRRHKYYPLLQETVVSSDALAVSHLPSFSCVYPSDQANFKCGAAVCACKKLPVIGHCINRIHTKRDTVCDEGNVAFLAEKFSAFAEHISE